MVIQLSREKIHLRFSVSAHTICVLSSVMNMMWERSGIVKKFGKHRPLSIFFPQILSNNLSSRNLNGIAQQNSFFAFLIYDNVAQPLILSRFRPVFRPGGRGKPSFINSSPACTLPSTSLHRRAWHRPLGHPFKPRQPPDQAQAAPTPHTPMIDTDVPLPQGTCGLGAPRA